MALAVGSFWKHGAVTWGKMFSTSWFFVRNNGSVSVEEHCREASNAGLLFIVLFQDVATCTSNSRVRI